jgi:hypothetical protein
MTPDTLRSRRVFPSAAGLLVLVLAVLLVVRVSARQPQVEGVQPGARHHPSDLASLDILLVVSGGARVAAPVPHRPRPAGSARHRHRQRGRVLRHLREGARHRSQAALDFMERRAPVAGLEQFGPIVPGNDPLLLEAELWCDQAEMPHPGIFPIEGWTPIAQSPGHA